MLVCFGEQHCMIFNQTVSGAADADWGNCNLDRRRPDRFYFIPQTCFSRITAAFCNEFEVGFGARAAFLMQLCQGANEFMWPNMYMGVNVCVAVSAYLTLAMTHTHRVSYRLTALINGQRKLMRCCVPLFLRLLLLPSCCGCCYLCLCFCFSLFFYFFVSSCGLHCFSCCLRLPIASVPLSHIVHLQLLVCVRYPAQLSGDGLIGNI